MKTASELRFEAAQKQRIQKTRDKWEGFAKRVDKFRCWDDITEHDDIKIGDKVGFVDKRHVGDCISFTSRQGVAFAFNKSHMIVIYRGEMKRVEL